MIFLEASQGSEDLGDSWISAGAEELSPGAQLLHTGSLGAAPAGTVRKEGLHPQLSRMKLLGSAACPALPAHRVPGLGRTQGPESLSARTKQLRPSARPPLPSPANLKASPWAPAYSPCPAAGSPTRPHASDPALGAPNAAAAAAASSTLRNPRPGLCLTRPAPHAPALPCSPVRAPAVPVRCTRPSPQGSSPGAAPRGAPGSGQGSARPGAG